MVLTGIAAVLLAVNCATASPVVVDRSSFPGDVISVQGPAGRYSLRWIPQPSPGGQHELLLCDRSSGSETRLLAFPRGVAALWSPSGSHLSIGNRWASDEATVLLWAALPGKPLDLLEELAKQEHQTAARWNAHHLYLDPVAWAGDAALDVHLWGYGDPNAPMLDRTYRYSLGRGFRRLGGMGAQPKHTWLPLSSRSSCLARFARLSRRLSRESDAPILPLHSKAGLNHWAFRSGFVPVTGAPNRGPQW